MDAARKLHVVVAGAGAAATETLTVLREHARARVRVTMVAPEPGPAPVVLPVAQPFSAVRPARPPALALARDMDAELLVGRVAAVDGDRRRVRLADGQTLRYDALVLAIGARPRPALDRGLTLFGDASRAAVERLTAGLQDAWAEPLAFVVPPGVTRTLSLYELAAQVGMELSTMAPRVGMRLLTPEQAPLEHFGPGAQAAMARVLDEVGVAFVGSAPANVEQRRIVTLPVLDGPRLPGVPETAEGFIPVDDHGAVPGVADVYAVGDATACPVKHVDVACAQADAVADVLSARAGAEISPGPWRAVVRDHHLSDFGFGALSARLEPATPAAVIVEAHDAVLVAVRSLGVAAGIEGARFASVDLLATRLTERGLLDDDVQEDLMAMVRLYESVERADAAQRR
jgi:hypothetical protein